MKKLTDEEISRVLSQQSIGKLKHDAFYDPDTECGCVAGSALAITFGSDRAREISWGVNPSFFLGVRDYPDTPEALLAYLAERGLA